MRTVHILFLFSTWWMASCSQVAQEPSTVSSEQNGKLEQSQLDLLLAKKKRASQLAEPMLASGNTGDMIQGCNLLATDLKQAYLDLVRQTRGENAFGGQSPESWADSQIEPAARSAQLEYEKRFAAGLDGSAGRLDGPEMRLKRVEELIEREVRNYTSPTDFQRWLPRWRSL